jgi:four helix bundle protein
MGETAEQLKRRTMRFALDVCALIRELPAFEPGPTVQRQLARAATGVAFNYRATCRARSHADFTARMGVVAEEADEAQGWLEFLESAHLLKSETLTRLIAEAAEIVSITSAAYGTARRTERSRNHARHGWTSLRRDR